MNQLNTNHKLILFSLLFYFFSNIALWFMALPGIFEYLLTKPAFWQGVVYVPVLLEFVVPILGLAIISLAITNKIEKIEFALIPILIFYAYVLPWSLFQYGISGLPILFSSFANFGLLSYGTYFLIKEGLGQDEKITEIKNTPYKPSDELSDKEFLPTLLLCLFVGMLGVHRFYAGKIGTGILLIVTLGGLGIWVLVDFIMICIGSFRDIEGRIIKYQRAVVIMSERGAAEELEKFAELKEKGIISEEEFNKKKEELL